MFLMISSGPEAAEGAYFRISSDEEGVLAMLLLTASNKPSSSMAVVLASSSPPLGAFLLASLSSFSPTSILPTSWMVLLVLLVLLEAAKSNSDSAIVR